MNIKDNRDRHKELVLKKFRGPGLTDDEQKELVEIETAIREAVMKEFPPLKDAEQNPNQTGH